MDYIIIGSILVVGAGLAWMLKRQSGGDEAVTLRAKLEGAEARVHELEDETRQLREDIQQARVSGAEAEVRAGEARKALETLDRQLKDSFASIANGTMKDSVEAFLKLANENLDKKNSDAAGELEKRRAAIEEMVKPLEQQLKILGQRSETLHQEQKEGQGNIQALVQSLSEDQARLRQVTTQVANALQDNQLRGKWGEQVLERLFEWAGMRSGVHYDRQVIAKGDQDQLLKPDFVVHLPGKRDLIVDSKAVFDHYVAATNENDPTKVDGHLKLHAEKVKSQVALLAKKEYHRHVNGNPAEFTVLFMPSDSALAAALDTDEELFEKASRANVVLASPNTMMALLRVVEKGWRDAEMAENAREIAGAGKELMNRFRVFWDHLGDLRKGLSGAMEAYNKAVGSLERNVIPGTQTLIDKGVKGDRNMKNKLKPADMPIDANLKEPGPAPVDAQEDNLRLTSN